MFTLYTEHLSETHRQELLKEAYQHHLVAQANETRSVQGDRWQHSLSQAVRSFVYAGMDWSGNRLIQFGSALRKVHAESGSQDQAPAAELWQG